MTYPLGTDSLGRCVLSRTLCGARTSLGRSLAASFLAVGVGALFGLGSALGARRVHAVVLNGLIDVFLAFPGLILALVIIGVFGTWGSVTRPPGSGCGAGRSCCFFTVRPTP